MLLVTTATQNEIAPLARVLATADKVEYLVTGMGPVTTAATLSNYLTLHGSSIDGLLHIGIAGAYVGSGITVLDICMAQQEFLGDFGICMQDGIQDFDPGLLKNNMPLIFDNYLASRCKNILHDHGIEFKIANFVTVNCCTGTTKRGAFLRDKYGAGCENMEGAAVAMVCQIFAIPCVELRCVSNMVEDRDVSKWQLPGAIEKICRVAGILLHNYVHDATSPD